MQGDLAARRVAGLIVGLLAALGVVASAACGGSDDQSAGCADREVCVYAEVLDWLVESPAPADPAADLPIVFIASRSETPIDIEVQVALVDAFAESVTLRFVDERSEAVIEDEVDRPVRDDGTLVGLGAVDSTDDVVEVYADRYVAATLADAWVFTLARSGESWRMRGEPLPSEVRPLPVDS